jgi:GDP-L-fucose synthase
MTTKQAMTSDSRLTGKRFCITGGAGFLGRAVCQQLRLSGVTDLFIPRSAEFDLTRQDDVDQLFDVCRPQIIIHLAAEVGGIGANRRNPGRYIYANMAMGLNLIEAARRRKIEKFILVGSVCAYPKHCPVPFRETDLWSGFPEETNAPYGVAKRALGVMLDAYHRQYGLNGVYLIPVNLYGPHDDFEPETSHVIPAMIQRFCRAAARNCEGVTCWGTGRATREFLYVDDAAAAIVAAAGGHNDPEPINLGTGEEISVCDLATMIARLCGYHGRIEWDPSRPDGQPRRRIDWSRAAERLGWTPRYRLEEGLRLTIDWWRSAHD